MDAVWHYSFYTDTSTVTVHVRRLRAKIEPDPRSRGTSQTVWGVGYRFAAMSAAPAALLRRRWRPRSPLRGRDRLRRRRRRASRGSALVALGAACSAWPTRWRAGAARLGSLRRQFALGVAIAVGQLVVLAGRRSSQLMFVSAHDALLLTVLVVVRRAWSPCARRSCSRRGAMRDVELLRDGARRGRRGRARRPTPSPGRTTSSRELARRGQRDDRASSTRAERARRDLVAAVSHDLRTPITSLRLLAEAVGDDIVDARHAPRLPRAAAHALDALLGALIDDLFELSRLEAGDIAWTLEQVPLDELVDETVDAMRAAGARPRASSVRAERAADARGRRARNPEKLQRVLFNLMQNAIRHTPADGSVTVRAERSTARRRDRGRRHRRGDRRRATATRVFEPFFAGHAAARTRGGAGLGPGDLPRDRRGPRRPDLARPTRRAGTRVRFTLPRS